MPNYCNPCSTFRTLPTCLETLIVGTIAAHPNALVFVYLKNHTTGFEYRFESQLNGSGLLTLDVTDNEQFKVTPNHDYELWVTLQSATNTDERLTFTSNSVDYTCARVLFEPIYSYLATCQTLKVKS